MENSKNNTRCARGLWDSSVPGIKFDSNGECNYAKIFDRLAEAYPRGNKGLSDWNALVEEIKNKGKGKKYDCIIGVSGGTDSSYLLHLAKEVYKLRPLAVTLDNGWNSDISVKNIKKVTNALGIDLETYVIDYEEMKDILRAYIRACFPWIDIPTDLAIRAVLYRTASKENIKYIFIGNDFRSEGTQPNEWTHGDAKQLKYIHKKYGQSKLKTFPYNSYPELVYFGFVKKIKMIRPFYYLDYQKKNAQKLLKELYGWEYYGGHHHENIFTKFAIACWLYDKFKIDKRIITLSAQVLSGEISRQEGLEQLNILPYDPEQIERDKNYVLKKLEMTPEEFDKVWNSPNKSIFDYPSSLPQIEKFLKVFGPVIKYILPHRPMTLYQIEEREDKKSPKTD